MDTIRRRTLLAGLAATPGLLYLLLRTERYGVERTCAMPQLHDAGPKGDFSWQDYEWQKRTWGGRPHYNGRWSPDNVVVRDDGSVVLRLTNPGTSPVAAEMSSTRAGWGYGTYVCTFEADFEDVGTSMVWGSMFTYDNTQEGEDDSNNEIDAGEISAWGVPGGATRISGTVWDEGREPVSGHDVELPRGLRFFRTSMTWTPEEVSFVTTAGENAASAIIASSVVQGSVVPEPKNEQVYFNIWVSAGNGADPRTTPAFEVRLTSFAFTPFQPPGRPGADKVAGEA